MNVTSDHIDYHGSFHAYRKIKERIFARQNAGDLAILNADEETTASLCGRLTARTELFSSSGAVDHGCSSPERPSFTSSLREGKRNIRWP